MMKILGLDIGGANLKHAAVDFAADGSETTIHCLETFFPFWTDFKRFSDELRKIRQAFHFDAFEGVAVTMTAELADCFDCKRQGVVYIVDAIEKAFGDSRCRYYNTRGQLKNSVAAKLNWAETAASNWHASAWYLSKKEKIADGFFVDAGSTTTDIIALKKGMPVSAGATDLDRLGSGELLYAGMGRTPICSLLPHVRLNGTQVSIAREFFATMADAMIWLDAADATTGSTGTADGRSKSKQACRSRLCRMICADDIDLSDDDVSQIAIQCQKAFQTLVAQNITKVHSTHPEIPTSFLVTGSGKNLATTAINEAFANSPNSVRIVAPFDDATANQVVPARAVAAKYFFEHQGELRQ